jgi:penicillin V acylase-like amidase (Ntn superfamily)
MYTRTRSYALVRTRAYTRPCISKGVMTNEPNFQWHVENVKHAQWKQHNERPAFTIPGAFYPDERFLRIHLVKSAMPQPNSYDEAVMQAVHVLNTVTVPMGAQLGTDSSEGEGVGDHTKCVCFSFGFLVCSF